MAVAGRKYFLDLPLVIAMRFSETIIRNFYHRRYGTSLAAAVYIAEH